MSSKVEKSEKSSGSRMLKKAKSFRDEFKGLVKRRPSSSSNDTSFSDARHNVRTKRTPSRSGSRAGSISDERKGGQLQGDDDVDKLQEKVNKVNISLTYIKAVVDNEKLQVIPGTATVVLESVMDVFTIFSNSLMTQDSSVLTSRHKKVCQCLARFIQWADKILLHGNKGVDKATAHELISALSSGVEELKQITVDKLQDRRNNQLQDQTADQYANHNEGIKRSSLPEIPLTPREKQILDNTMEIGIYDNTSFRTSQSSDSIANCSQSEPFNHGGTPPPKPPLPSDPELVHRLVTQLSQEEASDTPPPIPLKENRNSLTNTLDRLSGSQFGERSPYSSVAMSECSSASPNQSPHNSLILPGHVMPLSQSPHGSAIFSGLSGHGTPQSQSPHSSMLFTPSPSQSPHNSVILTSQSTPNQSPHTSMVINSSHGEQLFSVSTTASSRSVTSSLGSGLNRSSEDLLDSSTGQRNSRANSFSSTSTSSESQVSSGFAGMNKNSSQSDGTVDRINQLTMQIDQLTSDITSMTNRNSGSSVGSIGTPPPLPTKDKRYNRYPSQYDNVDGSMPFGNFTNATCVYNRVSSEHRMSSSSTSSTQSISGNQFNKGTSSTSISHRTSSQETYSSSETFSSTSHSSMESLPKPPPLPPKKRHVQAYMQTIGNYTQPQTVTDCLYSRHSVSYYESQWQQHQREIAPGVTRAETWDEISHRSSDSSFSSSAPNSPAIPPLPVKRNSEANRCSQISTGSNLSDNSLEYPREKAASLVEGPTQNTADSELKRSSAPPGKIQEKVVPLESPTSVSSKMEIQKDCDSDFAELNPLDDIDVSDQLIKKKEGEDGPEIRGGSIDALIVHATSNFKSGSKEDLVNQEEFMYQEAFLTTYRTFISSGELIDKLLYRFHKFQHASDKKKKVSRNTFSLLIRVIDELSPKELEDSVIEKMTNLVFELLCQGELMLAKVLRKKTIEKCESIKAPADPIASMTFTSSITLKSSPSDLLLCKSHDIAEQMTLLDAELFQKIEIHEVSLWAREQSEELSPNLTEFTEHFNKMSFWCRTQILTPEDPKEREKYLLKFIKIMRRLRNLSNFNSYLAILSAVDSAPIRRLDWPRQNIEALKEFCQLIDSSSSFRAYRQALAETQPPCIPYIGLILQDLTFINIGNQDYLPDGNVNFAKRWQQFNILDNMRRFKKCNYQIHRNEKIINVFNNFDDYLSEDSLWQISEKIRPRGGAKKRADLAQS